MRIVQPRLVRKVGLSRDDEVRRVGDSGLIAASESHGAALHPHDDDLVQRAARHRYIGVGCDVVEDDWGDVDPGVVSFGVVGEARGEVAKRSVAP